MTSILWRKKSKRDNEVGSYIAEDFRAKTFLYISNGLWDGSNAFLTFNISVKDFNEWC